MTAMGGLFHIGCSIIQQFKESVDRLCKENFKRRKIMNHSEMQEKMEDALERIREVLVEAHGIITAQLLEENKKFKKKPNRKEKNDPDFTGYYVWPRRCGQKWMRKDGSGLSNDYRDYVWVTAENAVTKEKCYINLFYNNVDPTTGNPHTQFGRIQFGRGGSKDDFNEGKPSKKSEASLHDRIDMKPTGTQKDGYGILYYHGEKERDSGQAIFMGTFDPEKLVKDFIKFLDETREEEYEYVKGVNLEKSGDERRIVIALGKTKVKKILS